MKTISVFFVFLFIGIKKNSKREQAVNEDIDNNLFVTMAKLKDWRYKSSYIYYFDNKKYDGLYEGDGNSD